MAASRSLSVLPANFPNLLANGASGIAVGMATNIPPHNVGELCDAALHLIKFPNATADEARRFRAGSGPPDRRHHRRAARVDLGSLQDRARQLPSTRALEQSRIPAAAPIRSSSPRFPTRSRKRGSSPASPSCCRPRSCRSSPTSATNSPRTSASCSSRSSRTRRSHPADGADVQADRARDAACSST